MIERLSLEEWQAFDAAYPAPTFFARPAWALALADAYAGMQPAPLRVAIDRNTQILLPLMQVAGGAFKWKEYSGFPLGGYTCFMRADGTLATARECDRVISELARFADSATIIPWPLAAGPSTHPVRPHETAVVDLSRGLDAALSRVAGIFRRMAGQAERRGVECSVVGGESAVEQYYALLEASAKRWGLDRPSIPKALFSALVRRGGNDVEVWLAYAQGRAIGGGVVFYGAKEFFFWSAAMDAEYGRLRPSNALNFAMLRAAAARGMSYYNLGSSEGLPGVAKFKENLGATDLPYGEVNLTRAPYNLYNNIKKALAPRVRA